MAIFITGDTHGDFTRFKREIFFEQEGLTKEDFLIVCGDFGIWDDSASEHYWLDWLDEEPFTTLFVSGNHENYELLSTFPVAEWHGGRVQFIRPSVIHLMRGQIYDICGNRFFTMGGARSHDISDGILEPDDPFYRQKVRRLRARGALYRVNHISWWKEELPNKEEYEVALGNLDKVGWSVDYIVTHCCPTGIQDILSGGLYQKDPLTDFFEDIRQRCQFKCWFFGHYHDNRPIVGKYALLYEQIIEVEWDERGTDC